jgi:hypothetical protein
MKSEELPVDLDLPAKTTAIGSKPASPLTQKILPLIK